TMFVLMVIVNSYSPISGIICLFCLIFLFFESVFGICLGCKFYSIFYKEKAQYCSGEICEVKDRQPIQKVSGSQLLILLGFIVLIVLLVVFFHESFSIKPFDLFGLESHAQTK
ncbi:MAG: DUF4395 family protein, partial [Bacteroidota bacterium]|nr:DUF4395 family protein [Bacteroidota bacterium]